MVKPGRRHSAQSAEGDDDRMAMQREMATMTETGPMLVFISAKPSVTRARGAVDQRLVKPGSLCGFAVVYLLRAFRVACRTPRRRDQRLSGGHAWVAFATCPKRLMQASAFGPRLTLPVSRLRLMNPPMVLKAKLYNSATSPRVCPDSIAATARSRRSSEYGFAIYDGPLCPSANVEFDAETTGLDPLDGRRAQ
jgi:hypothetical protein